MKPIIHTIGHSTRSLEELINLLRAHSVRQLADVRRYPTSRRHPHFTQQTMIAPLLHAGIVYSHYAGLGGRREEREDSPHTMLRSPVFRAYADHMDSAEFVDDLAKLESWARDVATAVMCAEASPLQCHRRLLADALLRDGFEVNHILGEQELESHAMSPFARLRGRQLVYDGGEQTFAFPT